MAKDKMKKKTNDKEKEKDAVKVDAPGNNGNAEGENEEKNHSDEKENSGREDNNKESAADKLQEIEEKYIELTDKHLRLQAEFDNYRKRTLREKSELIKSGGESVLQGILPVIDDFERALNLMVQLPEDDPGKKGTLLIYSKFRDFLKQNSVQEIEALHHDFDVDLHEAITNIPAPEEKLKGKVVDVIQKGYLLNDKVIRYAKVVVGE